MSELREAAEEALRWMEHARLHLTIKERMHPDGLSLYDSAAEALRAALAQPETEPVAWMHSDGKVLSELAMKSIRRDFASFPEVFRQFSIPLYAHPPRDEWRPESRPCTCHPDDNPPQPCAQRYALTECKALAQPEAEAEPVAWQVKKGDDMSTLREAAQAAPDAEVRAQHKKFARWFLELGDKSALASEYLAWLAWKAALAHPPRNEWREAVHDELVTTWTFSAENKDDPRKALQDIINWHVSVSLDPAISSDAQAMIERGKAMRDGGRAMTWVKKFFCRHSYEFVRNVYGDEIMSLGWKRSVWRCTKCSKLEDRDMLHDVTPPMEGAK